MKYFYIPLFVMLAAAPLLVSCSDDDDDDNTVTPPAEFEAQNADFAGFTSWGQPAGPHMGPDPAEIGNAHGADNSNNQRFIYLNNADADRSNGEFPIGTIFVKRVVDENDQVLAVTAMAKRGNDFDPNNNDWEWFLLDNSTGEILNRGADLMGGACAGCHSQNASQDYVWAK